MWDHFLKLNISREEARILKGMKQDKSRVILTADKWGEVMVLARQDHINKAQDLLVQMDTYIPLAQNKLINILRTIMVQEGLGNITYK